MWQWVKPYSYEPQRIQTNFHILHNMHTHHMYITFILYWVINSVYEIRWWLKTDISLKAHIMMMIKTMGLILHLWSVKLHTVSLNQKPCTKLPNSQHTSTRFPACPHYCSFLSSLGPEDPEHRQSPINENSRRGEKVPSRTPSSQWVNSSAWKRRIK